MTYKKVLAEVAYKVSNHVLFCFKELLTVEETARYMGVSTTTVYRLLKNGTLKYSNPWGVLYYINREYLVNWMSSNKDVLDEKINEEDDTLSMKGGEL